MPFARRGSRRLHGPAGMQWCRLVVSAHCLILGLVRCVGTLWKGGFGYAFLAHSAIRILMRGQGTLSIYGFGIY